MAKNHIVNHALQNGPKSNFQTVNHVLKMIKMIFRIVIHVLQIGPRNIFQAVKHALRNGQNIF